jgi:hypothetical protein
MFNNRLLIAINTALSSIIESPKAPILKRLGNTGFSGAGPKKGMMSYHLDIRKQKLSRYPTVHQGSRECARRREQAL